MLSCKEVSQLVSQSLDEKLPLRKRIGVRIHLAMCHMCRAYRRQVLLLRQVLPAYARWVDDETGLSTEAAERMKKELIARSQEGPGENIGDDV